MKKKLCLSHVTAGEKYRGGNNNSEQKRKNLDQNIKWETKTLKWNIALFFFFIVNAFSCVCLCVVLLCTLLGNILWSFDSAFPTIRWLFNTSVENSLACRRACVSLCVHVDSMRTHMLLESERSWSQRCLCWVYCSPCGADGQLKLSSWV